LNIAIIDDHQLFAQALQNTLQQQNETWVVRAFKSGDEFLASKFDNWQPEIVLTDLLMPGTNGVEMVQQASTLFTNKCQFILMSSVTDIYTVKNALRKGLRGYVVKDASLEELLVAIETVREGKLYVSSGLKETLFNHIFEEEQIVYQLTPKENAVLQRLCAGSTPKEIAYDMNLSIHTIKQYQKAVMKKLKINRTIDLVVFAMQKGLYTPPLQ
jgi:DNA-binding NarL/FixJ family response regulator